MKSQAPLSDFLSSPPRSCLSPDACHLPPSPLPLWVLCEFVVPPSPPPLHSALTSGQEALSASSLSSLLLDSSKSNTSGTNWINYDLRSLENDLGVSDFNDTSFTLYFGILNNTGLKETSVAQ